jgi:DNA primase
MRLPDEIIEEVRAVADIVDVVGDYVRLKKRGSNFIGLCPFHAEKTPSFNVNPRLGIFKCFGCGEGGDVFSFVSRVENLPFPETVRLLAERFGVSIPEPEPEDGTGSEQESILHALRFAARFFHDRLARADDADVARRYLQRRGLGTEVVKRFGLGYAPDAWDTLLEAAREASIAEETLEKAGLVLPRREGGGWYDRYRARLVFPILSHVGKVLGFGGRILVEDPAQPKYVNSPETAVYHKSRVLYGLYQAKQAIRAKEEAILVEGYTDVVALQQAGVGHVVASSGTALTPDQVRLVSRYARRVLLLYDADDAGAKATARGIDLCLEGGLVPYVVALPDGEDPDTFVRNQGGEAFEAYLVGHRQEFVAYLHERARLEGTLDAPESRAAAQHAVVRTIGRIGDPLLRESYMQQAASVLDVPDVYLRRALERERRQGERRPAASDRGPERPRESVPTGAGASVESRRPSPGEPLPEEKTLLRLMFENGSEMVAFVLSRTSLDEFTEGPSRETVTHLVRLYQEGRLDRRPFLDGTFGDEVRSLASEVLTDAVEPSANWSRRRIDVPRLNEDPHAAAAGAMTLLKLDRLDAMIAEARHALFVTEQEGGDVRALQEELLSLQQLRRQIEDRQFLT